MTKKKYFNATLAAALAASGVVVIAPSTAEASFKDLKTTDYFYSDILNLQQRGIIQGFADGTFRPNAEVTRGQAAKILAGALGLDTVNVTNPGFRDIPKTHQYYGAIAALANAGIISGYEDKTFRQGEPILRNHMAKMIANGFKLVTLEGTTPFKDVRNDYVQYIAALYDNKVTTGKTATTFDGASNVTRGQLATFVVRAENVQAKKTFTIDEVTGNTIKTSTGELKATSATQAIFTEANAAALKGAQLTAVVQNNEIVEVKSLSIAAASSEEAPAELDLGQVIITGNVILNSASVSISNAIIQGKLVIDTIKVSPVASLGAIVANSTKGSTITLNHVTTSTVEVNRNDTTVAGTATVDTLAVVKAGEVSINIEGTIKTLNVLEKDSNITLGANTKIEKLVIPVGANVVDVIKNFDSIKLNIVQIETTNGDKLEAPTTSGSNSVYIPSTPTSNSNLVEQITGSTISAAGTYGPTTGKQVINGDLFINTANVNLQNVTINGNLILGEGIGEGDVRLNGVNVTGQTIVKGGGKNSIYFTDSVLATVIVNKNTGAVRIVAQGSTQVYEVQLETPTLVVEQNLNAGSSGFEDITVSETMQTAGEGFQVELTGVFETINSRATNVRINLSEQSDIRTLVLNAAAQVLGTGVIQQAHINAEGSTLSQRPQNLVLDINRGYGYSSVNVAGETVTESYSDPNATATLTAVLASQNAIALQLSNFIAGLTMSDFEVKAYIDGNEVELQGLQYDANKQRITYTPLNVDANAGKTVQVKVTSKNAKVTGTEVVSSYEVKTGFAGRITDIQYVGIPNLSIKFRAGSGTTQGEVVATATTDSYGYYSVNLPAGVYTGEFSAPGYVTSYMIANASTDVFLTDQHETAIRAAASQEIKIMLSWDKDPSDLDSHLNGPTVDGEQFHIYYGEKRTTSNGIVYADLDWDDVDSYGPETTTIRQLLDGEYRFYVHHYSGSSTLRTSGAKVQVFLGNATAPAHIFEVPEGEGTETNWNVFDLVVTNNGENVEVRPVNTLSEPREPQDENPVEDTENPETTTNDTAGVITTSADTVNIAFTNTEITQLTTINSIELITGTTADTLTITSADSIAVETSEDGNVIISFNKTRFTDLDETDVTRVTIRFRNENGEVKELEVSIIE